MISANGLVRNSAKTLDLLRSSFEEKPLSVQIFGADPEIMGEAAGIVAGLGADVLDINFGCSVKKVLKSGAGAALMGNFQKAQQVIFAVRKAVSIPFTIKMRSGWDNSGEDALTLANIAQDNGVDAIAVHPRTARAGFSGTADWNIIKAVKQSVSIPVIGNGDVVLPKHVIAMMDQTGCDAVMIGRAVMQSPWIFSQALSLMRGDKPDKITLSMRQRVLIDYIDSSVEYMGEHRACRMLRSRLAWFVKGLPHAVRFRDTITRISSRAEAKDLISRYFDMLTARQAQLEQ